VTTQFPRVAFVGAGPGDPRLLTVRGAQLLAGAEVVLYDDDVPGVVLATLAPDALAEPVRCGDGTALEASIGRLVEAARAGRRVVRLVAGDPGLDAGCVASTRALERAGLAIEVVPGIAPASAIAATAGLLLTNGAGCAMLVDDGADDAIARALAAGFSPILRATPARLRASMRSLAASRPSLCAAIVTEAATPRQRVVVSSLAGLGPALDALDPASTAVLVVGDAVAARERPSWFEARPLFGRRILVPRAGHQAGVTSDALRARGAEPIELPLLAIVEPPDLEAAREAVCRAGTYDWVIFTSDNGVDRFFRLVDEAALDARIFRGAKLAAIGEGTARSLRARGLRADLVPPSFRGEALADAVLDAIVLYRGASAGARVLLPRALVARDVVPERLRVAGVEVDVVPLYETRRASSAVHSELLDRLAGGALDAVLLASSSTAEALVEALGPNPATALERVVVASIGPITTATAERLGLRVDVTASTFTFAGLLDDLERYFAGPGRRPPSL
jgi:uroporphyrinogen III methyltransferase/synthase